MKTRNPLLYVPVLLGLAQFPASTFAQHVSGGGQGARTADGRLILMDTVENFAFSRRCDWKPMAEIVRDKKEFQDVMNKLVGVHAYAARAFYSEAERIMVCFTGTLKPIKEPTVPKIIPGPYYGTYQVVDAPVEHPVFERVNLNLETIGFRWNQKVLVDEFKFKNELSLVDQAMFLIHEIAHKFIPMTTPVFNHTYADGTFPVQDGEAQAGWKPGKLAFNDSDPVPTVFEAADERIFARRDRLWSFVNAIYRNFSQAGGLTRREFGLAITQNGATLPETDDFFLKSAHSYEVALDRNSAKRDRIIAISQLDWNDVKANLISADIQELEHFLNTWYTPAIQIMADRNYGWEQALKSQIDTYGLDPFQVLPNGESLITLASKSQDSKMVNFLLNFPAQSQDRRIRTQLFQAVVDGKIEIQNLDGILKQFDPNEGELIRKMENGYPVYVGEVPYLVIAVQKNNYRIAQAFLATGKVKPEVATQAVQALSKADLGRSQYTPTFSQSEGREVLDSLLKLSASGLNNDLLQKVLGTNSEYMAYRILDYVTPDAESLALLTRAPWTSPTGATILQKALTKPGVNLNAQDKSGFRMVDYAIQARNKTLFDILIKAGANQFQAAAAEEQTDFALYELIELEQTEALGKYIDQTGFKDPFQKKLDYARIRSKAKSASFLENRIQH